LTGVEIQSRVPVESWNLNEIDVAPQKPQVLDSDAEGRAIVINLPAGDQLKEHQVHERAWLIVTEGEIEVTTNGASVTGSTGFLAIFDPNERHEVSAKSDSRLLLVLSPWPGDGHPSARS
jgi:quercetin dioxygenase-like cupin family protein